MVRKESLYLLGNTLGQTFAFVSASLDIKQHNGKSILSFQSTDRGRALVSEYVGPVGMMGLGVISLAALLFGEQDSTAIYAIMSYFHLYIGSNLAYYAFTKKEHFLVYDPAEGMMYHLSVSLDSPILPKL